MSRIDKLYEKMAAVDLTPEDIQYYSGDLINARAARHWLVKGRRNLSAPTILMLETMCYLKVGMWQRPIRVEESVPTGAYLRKDGKLYVNIGGGVYEVDDYEGKRGVLIKGKAAQVGEGNMGSLNRFVTQEFF